MHGTAGVQTQTVGKAWTRTWTRTTVAGILCPDVVGGAGIVT